MPNHLPSVAITSGPMEGDNVHYRVSLTWAGEDLDGSILRYEIAVDPSLAFTEAEIAEGGPDIASVLVPGKDNAPDTTRLTKVIDGGIASFDWIHTVETSARFEFSTPEPDSAVVDTVLRATGRFHGYHAVYVRALDDDGASSMPDHVAFNAITVAPRAWIKQPRAGQDVIDQGPRFSASWTGFDPDSPGAGKEPAGYIYKLLRLDTLIPPISPYEAGPELLLTHGGDWTATDRDSVAMILQDVAPGKFLFGVRAVDAPGAVEPFLDLGRNCFKFAAFPQSPPHLIIHETTLGTFEFFRMPAPARAEAAMDIPLHFTWSTSAGFGGRVEAYSWGIDLVDPDDTGPESGWGPWEWVTQPPDPVVFRNAGLHNLCVRARDDLGLITRGILELEIVEFPFDREVLLVDDSFDDSYPTDSQHDAFWDDLVADYAAHSGIPPDQVFRWDVFGPNDRGNLVPSAPLLSDLSRYKLLIWECRGSGYNAQSGLLDVAGLSTRMASYLRAGGKLWLGGRMTVAATVPAPNLVNADLTYPKETLGPGDFAYDFLKLHSTRINNDKGERVQNLLNRANPYSSQTVFGRDGTVIADLPYDSLVVDLPKVNLTQRNNGGFSHCDAVNDPLLAEAEPGFRGDLDSLYAYGAAGPWYQGRASSYEGKLCALRWHDPDPAREHGRIQWFGFSLYFMETEFARTVFRKSLDWFRQEEPPHANVRGSME